MGLGALGVALGAGEGEAGSLRRPRRRKEGRKEAHVGEKKEYVMETLPPTSSPDAPLPSLFLPQKPTSCSRFPYSEPFLRLSSSSNPPILSALSSPFRCHHLQRPCPDFIHVNFFSTCQARNLRIWVQKV